MLSWIEEKISARFSPEQKKYRLADKFYTEMLMFNFYGVEELSKNVNLQAIKI